MRTRAIVRGTYVWTFIILMAGVFVGLMVSSRPAQSQSPGTTGAQFLRIEAGPRPSAMGGAYTALADDGYGMYWNPAGMSRRRRGSFVATHQEQLFEVFNEVMGMTYPMSSNQTVGVASRFRWDEQTRREELDTRSEFTNYDLSLGLNYAVGQRTGLAWGIGVKGIQSKLAGYTANTFAVDAGLHYQSPRTPLKLGMAIQNVGPEITFIEVGDPLPRVVRFGWAYDFFPYRKRVTISNDLVYLQPENATSVRLGLEVKPYEFLALRTGYSTPEGFDDDARVTAGLGVNYGDVNIDYAFRGRNDFSDQHRFSLSVDFGARPEPAEPVSGPDNFPVDDERTPDERGMEEEIRDDDVSPQATSPDVEELNTRAQIHFESGNYTAAIDLWKQSLAREPIQRDVFRKMAIAYYELGEYETARRYMQDASAGVDE